MKNSPKIALIHDWLVSMRGGEKVLDVLCNLFPDATLFTLVHRYGSCSPAIERMDIRTSFIQQFPFGQDHYQYYLPLYPAAVRGFDLRTYDIVISSSHAAAKGGLVGSKSLHFCYCHTPMRYLWDQYGEYFARGRASGVVRLAMKLMLKRLRRWDVETAKKVDYFVANSRNVQERIKRIYGRESMVIHPPVDVRRFSVSDQNGEYFLVVSALVPYKRIDLAVEAFNRMGKKLVIVGTGVEERRLQSTSKQNIEFVGWVNDDELASYYAGCRALIFPGEEDFGIVPVEAMACGKPVIAFAKGGVLETVVEGKTGVFFHEQKPESLEKAVRKLETLSFDPETIRMHTGQFDRTIFEEQIKRFVNERWEELLDRL